MCSRLYKEKTYNLSVQLKDTNANAIIKHMSYLWECWNNTVQCTSRHSIMNSFQSWKHSNRNKKIDDFQELFYECKLNTVKIKAYSSKIRFLELHYYLWKLSYHTWSSQRSSLFFERQSCSHFDDARRKDKSVLLVPYTANGQRSWNNIANSSASLQTSLSPYYKRLFICQNQILFSFDE